MATFIVKGIHHCISYRNGDKEAEDRSEYAEVFSTQKAAREYINSVVSSKYKHSKVTQEWHRGTAMSFVRVYTGNKWIHENTGEEHEETVVFSIVKQ